MFYNHSTEITGNVLQLRCKKKQFAKSIASDEGNSEKGDSLPEFGSADDRIQLTKGKQLTKNN
jgi:hypothetical protein